MSIKKEEKNWTDDAFKFIDKLMAENAELRQKILSLRKEMSELHIKQLEKDLRKGSNEHN